MGGKIIPRIRLTSAKDLVEVEAELGNTKKLIQEGARNLVCKIKIRLPQSNLSWSFC